jgi:hypothetical protein
MANSTNDQTTAEFRLKVADLVLKIVAAVVTFWVAHTAYHTLLFHTQEAQQKQEADRGKELHLKEAEIEQREKDYKVRFYNSQVEVYFELCDTTAKIALAPHMHDVLRELERFKELYVGRLSVIGDEEVYRAATVFNDALVRMRGKDVNSGELLRFAANVSRACRSSLKGAVPSIGELPPEGSSTNDLLPCDAPGHRRQA